MKKQSSPPPFKRPQPPRGPGQAHLKSLIIALVAWLGLWLIVLLEHGRSWAKLLPLLFVIIVVYGVYVTWTLIRESINNNQQHK